MVDLQQIETSGVQDAGFSTYDEATDDNDVLELVHEVASSIMPAFSTVTDDDRFDPATLMVFPSGGGGELLLDQEFDPAEGPRSEAAPHENPFIVVSLAGARPSSTPKSPRDRQDPAAADGELIELLGEARALVTAASASEGRSRAALYQAIGRAHDVALVAARSPDDLARLLDQAGIAARDAASAITIVRLVFGSDYDKTRLSEFAAALTHARRIGLGHGLLAQHLLRAPGGLKGVIAEERRLKRGGAGQARSGRTRLSASAEKALRAMPVRPIEELGGAGDEFVLVLARRLPDGTTGLVGELQHDIPLLERAARNLVNRQF